MSKSGMLVAALIICVSAQSTATAATNDVYAKFDKNYLKNARLKQALSSCEHSSKEHIHPKDSALIKSRIQALREADASLCLAHAGYPQLGRHRAMMTADSSDPVIRSNTYQIIVDIDKVLKNQRLIEEDTALSEKYDYLMAEYVMKTTPYEPDHNTDGSDACESFSEAEHRVWSGSVFVTPS